MRTGSVRTGSVRAGRRARGCEQGAFGTGAAQRSQWAHDAPIRRSHAGRPPKRLSVLGSTGSIGTQALQVARWRGYEVVALAAGRNAARLIEQVRTFRPQLVSCDAAVADEVRAALPAGTQLAVGEPAAVAAHPADVVVAAIPGYAGLEPTLAALREGRHVALANKEAMVVAGPLVWETARAHGARLTPVDSELSALFQCLQGEPREAVAALVLTASGGPFRLAPEDLSGVSPAAALKHPTWNMGHKVTIDSATLFNKGLEVLESHFFFDWPLERIEVVIHPQSLVHSLVRLKTATSKRRSARTTCGCPSRWRSKPPTAPRRRSRRSLSWASGSFTNPTRRASRAWRSPTRRGGGAVRRRLRSTLPMRWPWRRFWRGGSVLWISPGRSSTP